MQINYKNCNGELAHTVFRFATENNLNTNWSFHSQSWFNVSFGLINLQVKPLSSFIRQHCKSNVHAASQAEVGNLCPVIDGCWGRHGAA